MVLGPTLFLVYIDNLEAELKKLNLSVKIIKFADDTKGRKVITSAEDSDKLQRALDCQCE